jgi:hypothetical protein
MGRNDESASDGAATKKRRPGRESGAIGWGVLWLIGIPIPVLLFFFVIRGCT